MKLQNIAKNGLRIVPHIWKSIYEAQAVKRMFRIVTKVSYKVIEKNKRDDLVRSKLHAQRMMPN